MGSVITPDTADVAASVAATAAVAVAVNVAEAWTGAMPSAIAVSVAEADRVPRFCAKRFARAGPSVRTPGVAWWSKAAPAPKLTKTLAISVAAARLPA